MATTNSSGIKKRRRRGPSLTFRTPTERRKARSVVNKTVNKSDESGKVDNDSVGASTSAIDTQVKGTKKRSTKTTAKVNETSKPNEQPTKQKRARVVSNKVGKSAGSDSAGVSNEENNVISANKRSTRTVSRNNATTMLNKQPTEQRKARVVSNNDKSSGSEKVDSETSELKEQPSKRKRPTSVSNKNVGKSSESEAGESHSAFSTSAKGKRAKGVNKNLAKAIPRENETAEQNKQPSLRKRPASVSNSDVGKSTESKKDDSDAAIPTSAKGKGEKSAKTSFPKGISDENLTSNSNKQPGKRRRRASVSNKNVSKSDESDSVAVPATTEVNVNNGDKRSTKPTAKSARGTRTFRNKSASESVQINDNESNVNTSNLYGNTQTRSKKNTSHVTESATHLQKSKTTVMQRGGTKVVHGGKRQLKDSSVMIETDTVSSPKKKSKSSDNTTSDELSSEGHRNEKSQAKPKAIKGRGEQTKKQVIPDRIKDVHITKKAFEKWKPLRASTIEFTEETLNSIILTILGRIKGKDGEEVANILKDLKNRILARLPNLKAPHSNGDHKKMDSQNERVEQQFLDGSREIRTLNQKVIKEQRLLAADIAKEAELVERLETCTQQILNLKPHPLVKKSKNIVNLPHISLETDVVDELCDIESDESEKKLRRNLLELRKKVGNVGLVEWMAKLRTLVEGLREDN